MKHKVILSKRYVNQAIEELENDFELIIAEDKNKSLLEVLKDNPDTSAVISFLSDNIDKEFIDAGKNLKIISNYAVGYNNIDINYAKQKGIVVTNTPDVLTAATADLTMALILSVSRKIVESDKYVRQNKFKGWNALMFLGKELKGATIGIVGLGRIGTAVGIRAKAFGMNVIYYSRTRKPEIEKEYGFEYKTFVQLIKNSDIISLHLPYSEDVHHLFDKDVFDLMKKDAIFINVARGKIVDEDYLAKKLEKKELFGAGLDVYEFEPKVNEKLKSLDNVVLTPHTGSATFKTRYEMAKITINNIKNVLSGKEPITPV